MNSSPQAPAAPSADKSGEPARGRVTDAERGMNLTEAYPKPLTTLTTRSR